MVLKTRFSKKVVQAATQKSSTINVTTDWLIAQATGYLHTGYLQLAMLDEAERLLNQVPEREAKPHLAAQNTPFEDLRQSGSKRTRRKHRNPTFLRRSLQRSNDHFDDVHADFYRPP